jgi:hypothetical protein
MTVTAVDLMKITRPAIMARIDMIIATITGSVNMINMADTTGVTIARFPIATAHTTAIIIGTAKGTVSLDPSRLNALF